MLNGTRGRARAFISSRRWSQTFAGDALNVLCAQLVLRGGFALISLLAARTLSVATFTDYNLFLVNSALVASLTGLGLPVAVSIASARFRASYDPVRSRAEIDRAFALFVLLVFAQLAAAPLIVRWLPASPHGREFLGFYAVAAAVLANGNSMVFAIISGMRLYRRLALISASGVVALALGYLAAVRLQTITPLLVSNLLFYALPAAFAIRRLWKIDLLPWRSMWASHAVSYMSVARVALPSFASGVLFSYANWLIATTLLAQQVDPIMFPTFAVGMQWFAILLFVPTAVGMAALSHLVAASAQGTLSVRLIAVPAVSAFFIGLALCALATSAAPLLNSAYGGKYAIDRPFVAIILLAASCSAPVTIISNAVITASGAAVWLRMNIIYGGTIQALVLLLRPDTAIGAATTLAIANAVLIVAASVQMWFSLSARHEA